MMKKAELEIIKEGKTGHGILIENDGYMYIKNAQKITESMEAGEWNVPYPFIVDAVFQKFGVKNVTNGDIIYDVGFTDQSNYLVNMKYKLKIDNIYIVGDENHYVSLDQMKVNDITVVNGSNNIFTIEWYWEDDDPRDVIVGMAEPTQYYTLNLAINAREYQE